MNALIKRIGLNVGHILSISFLFKIMAKIINIKRVPLHPDLKIKTKNVVITSKQTLIWISPVLLISHILFGHKWKSDYVMIWDIQGWCAMVSLLNSKSIGFRTGNSDPILEENNAGNCHKCPIIQSSMDSRVKTSACLVNDRCTCPS